METLANNNYSLPLFGQRQQKESVVAHGAGKCDAPIVRRTYYLKYGRVKYSIF